MLLLLWWWLWLLLLLSVYLSDLANSKKLALLAYGFVVSAAAAADAIAASTQKPLLRYVYWFSSG